MGYPYKVEDHYLKIEHSQALSLDKCTSIYTSTSTTIYACLYEYDIFPILMSDNIDIRVFREKTFGTNKRVKWTKK